MSFNAGVLNGKYLLHWVQFYSNKSNCSFDDKKEATLTPSSSQPGLLRIKSGCCKISIKNKWSRLCMRHYLCSHTLKETGAFCTSFSACSEMRMFPSCSRMEHHSLSPCRRRLPYCLCLGTPLFGLELSFPLHLRP